MYVHLWGMAYWPLNEGSPFNAGLKNLRVIQENKSSEISIPQQIDCFFYTFLSQKSKTKSPLKVIYKQYICYTSMGDDVKVTVQ